MMNAKIYTSQNNYDDFCDINAETSLFCGLDYDEFNKTSYFVGSIMTNSIKHHKVQGQGLYHQIRHRLCAIVTLY